MKTTMTNEEALRCQLAWGPDLDSYWRHKRTGNIYRVVCTAFIEATMDLAVMYSRGGVVWVRPEAEFLQRFERWTRE